MQNNSFITIHRVFLSSAALIACQAHHHRRGQAGTRIQLMCRGVGDEVIIHEPACTQAGHALVQSSLSAVLI